MGRPWGQCGLCRLQLIPSSPQPHLAALTCPVETGWETGSSTTKLLMITYSLVQNEFWIILRNLLHGVSVANVVLEVSILTEACCWGLDRKERHRHLRSGPPHFLCSSLRQGSPPWALFPSVPWLNLPGMWIYVTLLKAA